MKSKSQKRRAVIQKDESKRHKAFDLNIKTDAQAELFVSHMLSLKANVGWALLKQILEGNINTLEQVILNKRGVDGRSLEESQVDSARARRDIMIEMVNKPDELVRSFQKKDLVEVPSYDPFATDIRQFSKPTFGGEMSRTLQP